VVFLVLLFLFGLLAFRRGEYTSLRVRVSNQFTFVLVLFFFALAVAIAADTGLIANSGELGEVGRWAVVPSPLGTHIAVVRFDANYSMRAVISIVDVQTGSVVQNIASDMLWMNWAANGDLLVWNRGPMWNHLGILPRSDYVDVFSPASRKRSHSFRFQRMVGVHRLLEAPLQNTSLVRFDEAVGQPQVVMELDGFNTIVDRVPNGAMIVETVQNDVRVWKATPQVAEIPWAGEEKARNFPSYVVDGVAYFKEQLAAQAIERKYGHSPESGLRSYISMSGYFYGDPLWLFELSSQPGSESATLSVRNPVSGAWKRITDQLNVGRVVQARPGSFMRRYDYRGSVGEVEVASMTGVAVFLTRSDGKSFLNLYDPRHDRTLSEPVGSAEDRFGGPDLTPVSGFTGSMVSLRSFTQRGVTPIQLLYDADAGTWQKLDLKPTEWILYANTSGKRIIRTESTVSVTDGGQTRTLWPLTAKN
jgi:hypothetical protein